MTPKAFHALFGRIGARAKMRFPIHPHMLRHGCGYALARPRYSRAAGLSRSQEHPAHGALHRAGAGQVQELLAIGDGPSARSRTVVEVMMPTFPRSPYHIRTAGFPRYRCKADI